jgi:hypothetical protein
MKELSHKATVFLTITTVCFVAGVIVSSNHQVKLLCLALEIVCIAVLQFDFWKKWGNRR